MESYTKKSSANEKEHPSKRQKTTKGNLEARLNSTYEDKSFVELFSKAFSEKASNTFGNGAKIATEPFTHCILPNFIEPLDYVSYLKNEIIEMKMETKINDLYQFKQSGDLDDCQMPSILVFKKLMNEKCVELMKKITNIPLANKVDISCACYTHTDHLLCHDDELEGRRIAFIYYLVPEWDKTDGGTLDLFSTVDGQPCEIHTSIVPSYNNFVFFEVSPISYHQVAEVLSDKSRLSISGWFHGPPLKLSIPFKESVEFKPPADTEIDITDWINPVYLNGKTQLEIREDFEDRSEISLPGFLEKRKYNAVCKALADSKLTWIQKGPPNVRKYHEISNEDMPEILQQCQDLFCSEAFLLILSNLTALKLHPVCEEGSGQMGKVSTSIRKWSHGSYTLLHDQAFSQSFCVHTIFYFNCSDWDSQQYGGYTSYVAVEEKEELLRIEPEPNSLAIVYITEGCSSFVKYINSCANNLSVPFFHDIFTMYSETE